DVVERLDVMPLQVHIEAQVVEVKLSGDLKYGVNWFFEQAVSAPATSGGAGLPSALGRDIWGDLAGSIGSGGASWTFLGRNAAAVISALDEVTDLRLLQTPSVLVRNNVEATLNVGTRIPIQSVSFNPGGVGDTGTVSQVQYLDTGVILKVRPRVTRDGMVFLDIVQEVSSPGAVPASCASNAANCNVPIDTRRLKTEAAIQSGETVMLAGLISDSASNGSTGVPGLSRLPLIGSLFGTRSTSTDRSEVIVLLTPSIVRNPQQARDLTDEYGRRFRAMRPRHATPCPAARSGRSSCYRTAPTTMRWTPAWRRSTPVRRRVRGCGWPTMRRPARAGWRSSSAGWHRPGWRRTTAAASGRWARWPTSTKRCRPAAMPMSRCWPRTRSPRRAGWPRCPRASRAIPRSPPRRRGATRVKRRPGRGSARSRPFPATSSGSRAPAPRCRHATPNCPPRSRTPCCCAATRASAPADPTAPASA